jgi:mono/diheme cytochrome c family protein
MIITKIKLISVLSLAVFILASCNTYVSKGLKGDIQPRDKSQFKTFNFNEVQAILSDNCYECHSSEKPHQPDLTSYAKVMRYVIPNSMNSDLLTEMKNNGGSMPKGQPQIGPNSYDLIRLWVLSGAPEFAGQGHEPDDGPTPPPPDIQIAVEGKFSDLNTKVFQPYCVKCHQPHPDDKKDKDPAGGIDLTSYQTLANSDSLSGLPVITPGIPDQSTLWDEMDKRGMPKPEKKARLSQSVTDAIATWIKNGANND